MLDPIHVLKHAMGKHGAPRSEKLRVACWRLTVQAWLPQTSRYYPWMERHMRTHMAMGQYPGTLVKSQKS